MGGRIAKLSVDPADVTINEDGHVVIRDAALSAEVMKLQGSEEDAVKGDILCDGCPCTDGICDCNVNVACD